jgi:hypothetical protein
VSSPHSPIYSNRLQLPLMNFDDLKSEKHKSKTNYKSIAPVRFHNQRKCTKNLSMTPIRDEVESRKAVGCYLNALALEEVH